MKHVQITPMGKNRIRAYLSRLALFGMLDQAELDALATNVVLVKLSRKMLLISKEQCLNEIYALIEGTMKLYLLSGNGQQRVVRLLQAGDCFGEELLINQRPSPVYVEALSACRVLAIPAPDLLDLLARDKRVALAMVQILSSRVLKLTDDLQGCCLQSALQRIVQYLFELKSRDHSAENRVELPASKVVIASLLNLTPETLSRWLHHLSENGLIRIDRREIHLLDGDGLKAIQNGNSS